MAEHSSAPVSRALLFLFLSVSLLCSLYAILFDRASAPQTSLAATSGAVSMAGAVASLRFSGSVLCSWLAWPTTAETIAGSILLLRLFSCERHLSSPQIAVFLLSALSLALACALGSEVVARTHGGELALAKSYIGYGWGPSVVYGALIVRHLLEIPARTRVLLLGCAHVNEKFIEVLLSLQVSSKQITINAEKSNAIQLYYCAVYKLSTRQHKYALLAADRACGLLYHDNKHETVHVLTKGVF